MAIVGAIAIVCFIVYYISPYGRFVAGYSYSLYQWNSKDLYSSLKEYYISMKIHPVQDELRDRSDFILEQKTDVVSDHGSTYNSRYFTFNNTVKNFPVFVFNDEAPKAAASEQYCFHLWYKAPYSTSGKSIDKVYGSFADMLAQPQCLNGPTLTKHIWASTVPTTGGNFPLWKEHVNATGCMSDTCKHECQSANGEMDMKTGDCYSYDIIDQICATFYLEYINGKGVMEFSKGCYTDGEYAHYKKATRDKQYKMEYIPVYARSVYDPWVVSATQGFEHGADTSMFFYLGVVLMLVVLVLAVMCARLYTTIKKASAEEVAPVLP